MPLIKGFVGIQQNQRGLLKRNPQAVKDHFQNLFCTLFALSSGTCYDNPVVKSDANHSKTSKQRTGFQEQWTGADLSSICRLLCVLRWETFHNNLRLNCKLPGYAKLNDKTVFNLQYDWSSYAGAPWSPFLSGLPRICLLQHLLLLSCIRQTCLGNIRGGAKVFPSVANITKPKSRTENRNALLLMMH